MKFRFLNVTSDLLAETMNYLVLLCFWAVGNAVANIPDRPWLMAMVLLVPYALYFVRAKVDGFFLFTIIHVIIPVVGIKLCPDLYHKIVIGIILIAISTISYVVSMKCEGQGAPCFHPVFAGGVMFGAIMLVGMVDEERLIYIPKLALLFAGLYLPYFYIERFTWFDYINSKTMKNIPTADSFRIGAPIVGGLSLFYTIAAFVGLNETLIKKMSDGIRVIIKKLMILFFSNAFEGQSGSVVVTPDVTAEEEMIFDVGETSPLALFFEKLAIYLVMVVAVLVILAGLFVLITSLIDKLKGRKRVRRVKVMEDSVETRESLERNTKVNPIEALIQEGSYANRIRKMYRKIVRKNSQLTDKPELFTVRGFSELFKDKNAREEAERFAVMYEKARYSADEVTKEDYLCARRSTSFLM